MNLSEIIKNSFRTSLWKTIFFNFHYLSIKDAIKFPIIVYHGVVIREARGKIIFQSKVHFKMLCIGTRLYGFQTNKDKTVWEVQKGGEIKINAKFTIGKGQYIVVGPSGILELGENSRIWGGKGKLICFCNIKIGNNTGISWDVTIMDTDFHEMVNQITGKNNIAKKPIIIGKDNWIGFGTTILKGVQTPNNCVVGARSVLSGEYHENPYCLLAGHPAKLIKTGICRNFDSNVQ